MNIGNIYRGSYYNDPSYFQYHRHKVSYNIESKSLGQLKPNTHRTIRNDNIILGNTFRNCDESSTYFDLLYDGTYTLKRFLINEYVSNRHYHKVPDKCSILINDRITQLVRVRGCEKLQFDQHCSRRFLRNRSVIMEKVEDKNCDLNVKLTFGDLLEMRRKRLAVKYGRSLSNGTPNRPLTNNAIDTEEVDILPEEKRQRLTTEEGQNESVICVDTISENAVTNDPLRDDTNKSVICLDSSSEESVNESFEECNNNVVSSAKPIIEITNNQSVLTIIPNLSYLSKTEERTKAQIEKTDENRSTNAPPALADIPLPPSPLPIQNTSEASDMPDIIFVGEKHIFPDENLNSKRGKQTNAVVSKKLPYDSVIVIEDNENDGRTLVERVKLRRRNNIIPKNCDQFVAQPTSVVEKSPATTSSKSVAIPSGSIRKTPNSKSSTSRVPRSRNKSAVNEKNKITEAIPKNKAQPDPSDKNKYGSVNLASTLVVDDQPSQNNYAQAVFDVINLLLTANTVNNKNPSKNSNKNSNSKRTSRNTAAPRANQWNPSSNVQIISQKPVNETSIEILDPISIPVLNSISSSAAFSCAASSTAHVCVNVPNNAISNCSCQSIYPSNNNNHPSCLSVAHCNVTPNTSVLENRSPVYCLSPISPKDPQTCYQSLVPVSNINVARSPRDNVPACHAADISIIPLNNMVRSISPCPRRGLREIVIDGNNVALGHTNGVSYSIEGLQIAIEYFTKRGHKVIAFVPQYRVQHGECTNPGLLHKLYKLKYVVFTPSRRVNGKRIVPYDDRYILDYATIREGIVVSCDQYRDLLHERRDWRETIEKRLLMPTWVGDVLMFPEDPLGRRGPKLSEFLRFP